MKIVTKIALSSKHMSNIFPHFCKRFFLVTILTCSLSRTISFHNVRFVTHYHSSFLSVNSTRTTLVSTISSKHSESHPRFLWERLRHEVIFNNLGPSTRSLHHSTFSTMYASERRRSKLRNCSSWGQSACWSRLWFLVYRTQLWPITRTASSFASLLYHGPIHIHSQIDYLPPSRTSIRLTPWTRLIQE